MRCIAQDADNVRRRTQAQPLQNANRGVSARVHHAVACPCNAQQCASNGWHPSMPLDACMHFTCCSAVADAVTLLVLADAAAAQLEQRLRMLPGLVEKLEQGVKVADVGCG